MQTEPSPKPILAYEQPPKRRSVLATGFIGAAVLGGLGFAGGFFGPLIFTPEANQGPLLGICFTGPLGVVVGFVAGLIVGRFRKPKET